MTNPSRLAEDLPKLTPDVGSNIDASSSSSSVALTTIVTESISPSNVLTRSVDDTADVSIEGAPYMARNPGADIAGRSNIVEMIPQLSPNQTGVVLKKVHGTLINIYA